MTVVATVGGINPNGRRASFGFFVPGDGER
jgi:hypothetical protein